VHWLVIVKNIKAKKAVEYHNNTYLSEIRQRILERIWATCTNTHAQARAHTQTHARAHIYT